MIAFQTKMLLRMITAHIATFGVDRSICRMMFVMPGRILINEIGLLLDHAFYPGHLKIKVERPLFLIGHPRSGTTFLHRLLHQTREFAAFSFWEILFPSITTRKLFSPVMKRQMQNGTDTIFPKEVGHELTLDAVEEEELLLLQKLNTQFASVVTPLGFADRDFEDLIYSDDQPGAIRQKTVQFLEDCFRRQIFLAGRRQVIANMNYSGMRLRSLLEQFPDARVVYVVRSPYETIPSHMTLHRNMFAHIFGLDRIPTERLQRYFERRYRYDVAFYRYIEEIIAGEILKPSQLLILRYDDIKNDLAGVMARIEAFSGLEFSRELRRLIDNQAEKQSAYTPPHKNLGLEEFGLNRARVGEDLAFIFDKYGFKK